MSANPSFLPLPVTGLIYLCAYVLVDWASYVHPYGTFGITPWNPSTGLGFILVLARGLAATPLLFIAPLVADLFVRGLTVPIPMTIVLSLVVGSGYSAATALLLHPRIRFAVRLDSVRDLTLLMIVAVLSSSGVAWIYVTLLIRAGYLPIVEFWDAFLRYWVGDMIGIAVITPLGLLLRARKQSVTFDMEAILQGLFVLLALSFAALTINGHQFQFFYILYLPVVWVSVRFGLEGVSIALMLVQLGLFACIQLSPDLNLDVIGLQARMFVLTVTGLIAGALVSERRRTELQLRLNQEAMSRLGRMRSMGDVSAAIAHELNQPISSAGVYARLVAESLDEGPMRDPVAADLARKTVAQIERASDVMHKLRTLIRYGRSEMAAIKVAQVIEDALGIVQQELEQQNIVVQVSVDESLPLARGDHLQIEQLIINLLRNSLEAIEDQSSSTADIKITATCRHDGRIEITVRDTGPGFSAELSPTDISALSSKKESGLGLGLSICRTIAEAHGGQLEICSTAAGARVSFTLGVWKAAVNA